MDIHATSKSGDDAEIRLSPEPLCYSCGSLGALVYSNLLDGLFGASGTWHIKKCKNLDCGLLWLDPMPRVEDLPKAYNNYYTHIHEESRSSNISIEKKIYELMKDGYLAGRYGYPSKFLAKLIGYIIYLLPARRANLEFDAMYLPYKEGGRLLEVGCGSGQMLSKMRTRGWEVEGVDFDPLAVENASRKGLRVHLGPIEQQAFSASSFDAVVMSHVIEHVPDPRKVLNASFGLLRPGGRLIIMTPNAASMGHAIFKSNWRGLEPPRHLHVFTLASLEAMVKSASFVIERSQTTIRDANNMFKWSLAIKNGAGHEGVAKDTLSKFNGAILQYLEWIMLKFSPNVGEEIMLVAVKK